MIDTPKEPIHKSEEEFEFYGDTGISSADAKVPKFLIVNYIFWPIWGIVSFCFFWNGSWGVFDPGYWRELQIAANTTFPIENIDTLSNNQIAEKEKPPQHKIP